MAKNIGAFFDIDGTLYRGSLMIEHYKKLVKYEVVDPVHWHFSVKKSYDDWKRRIADFDDYIEDLAAVYIEGLIGLNKLQLEFIADQVIKLKGEQVYSFARKQIEFHKEAGHKIFFISGSPDFLVEKMAAKYGVTEFIGTKYLTNDSGHFTGKIIPMWDSVSKNTAINNFVEKYDIDLEASFAYGDTNGDLSMLKLVGHPVAINPNRELVIQLKEDPQLRSKAKLIVERKDVVYQFDTDIEIKS